MEEQIELNDEEKNQIKALAQSYIEMDLSIPHLANDLARTEIILSKVKKSKDIYAFAFFAVLIPFIFVVLFLLAG